MFAAVDPKRFPLEEFGIVKEEPHERDKIAIAGAFAGASCADELGKGGESFLGSLHIDALGRGFFDAKLAEAGGSGGIGGRAAMFGPDGLGERAHAFGGPHDAVDVVGADVVFGETHIEGAVGGVVAARVALAAASVVIFVHGLPGGGGRLSFGFFDDGIGFEAVFA